MCSYVFRFSLLVLLGTSACGAFAQAPERMGLADNDNACPALLAPNAPLILHAADGQVVIDQMRQEKLNQAYRERDLALRLDPSVNPSPYDDRVHEIVTAFPRVGLGAAGGLVVLEKNAENGRRSIRYHRRAARLHAWHHGGAYLDHVHAVSPDGHFVILSTFDFHHQQLVDATSGEVLIERRGRTAEQTVAMKFSTNGRVVTVRVGTIVEIMALRPAVRMLAAHDIGSAEIDVELRTEAGELTPSMRLDARGDVHYLPGARALLAFFAGPEPVLLSPTPAGLRVLNFTPAPSTDYRPSTFAAHVDGWPRAFLAREDQPAYRPRGLVAPSEKFIVAVRTQYVAPRTESFLEFFDVRTRHYLRRFRVPGDVAALALSPNARFFAVAAPDRGGIRIFDLHDPGVQPHVIIQIDNYDGRLLSFQDDEHLLVGSDELSRLLLFDVGLGSGANRASVADVFR